MACKLRIAGVTYDQIAKQLGLKARSTARDLVLNAIKEHTREPAEEVRDRELQRLDDLMRGLWLKAKEGSVQHVDRVLKIMERRARYLGIDAPTKLEHSTGKTEHATAAMARKIMGEIFVGGVAPTPSTPTVVPELTKGEEPELEAEEVADEPETQDADDTTAEEQDEAD